MTSPDQRVSEQLFLDLQRVDLYVGAQGGLRLAHRGVRYPYRLDSIHPTVRCPAPDVALRAALQQSQEGGHRDRRSRWTPWVPTQRQKVWWFDSSRNRGIRFLAGQDSQSPNAFRATRSRRRNAGHGSDLPALPQAQGRMPLSTDPHDRNTLGSF